MFCTKCGNGVSDNSSFCVKCGNKVEVNDVPEIVSDKVSKGRPQKGLFRGRIARLRFFLGYFVAVIPLLAMVTLWGIVNLISSSLGVSDASSVPLVDFINRLIPFVIGLSVLLFFVGYFFLAIRRLHDLGYSGWFILLLFVPYLNLALILYLLFARGESGPNKYGNPPVEGRKFLRDVFNY